MEVYHHPDLHHKKKNFKEYFFEFLMIFLAVTYWQNSIYALPGGTVAIGKQTYWSHQRRV